MAKSKHWPRTQDAERIDSARIIEVLEVRLLRGTGTSNDACREVVQYWTKDGKLLVDHDEWYNEHWMEAT